jgi:hypothetical protein
MMTLSLKNVLNATEIREDLRTRNEYWVIGIAAK